MLQSLRLFYALEEIKCFSNIFQLHTPYSRCKEAPGWSPHQSHWRCPKTFHEEKNKDENLK